MRLWTAGVVAVTVDFNGDSVRGARHVIDLLDESSANQRSEVLARMQVENSRYHSCIGCTAMIDRLDWQELDWPKLDWQQTYLVVTGDARP